jgi:hypothetical protein
MDAIVGHINHGLKQPNPEFCAIVRSYVWDVYDCTRWHIGWYGEVLAPSRAKGALSIADRIEATRERLRLCAMRRVYRTLRECYVHDRTAYEGYVTRFVAKLADSSALLKVDMAELKLHGSLGEIKHARMVFEAHARQQAHIAMLLAEEKSSGKRNNPKFFSPTQLTFERMRRSVKNRTSLEGDAL